MNATRARQVFIPLDTEHPALLASDRLVAYQPGFVLLSQLESGPAEQALTAQTAAPVHHPAGHPVHPPCPR